MSRMQKGANEESQEKGVTHNAMIRVIEKEGSEDEGLRRVTPARGEFQIVRMKGIWGGLRS